MPSKYPPHNPEESNYHFGLDMDFINDEGARYCWYAFNRNLEVCFETHKLRIGETIVFREPLGLLLTLMSVCNYFLPRCYALHCYR